MGIRLKGQTSGYVEIKAPATAADNTLTFPDGNGNNGQILTTDGSGNLSFSNPADTDKITEGNTEAEVVDNGSDGHFKVTTEGSERVRVGPAGQIGIGGANYGSTGQVLTSTGGSSAASWSNVEILSDTSPQLGGHLDVNGNDIVTTSNGDIDLDPNGSGQVVFKGNATRGSGAVKLNCENNSHGILVKGPPHSAGANYTLTLPNDTGTSGQLLSTNGSGVTSWSTVNASPTFEATADGALTDGMPVVITSSGNVKSAAAVVTEHTPTSTSEALITNNNVRDVSIAYDETADRWIAVFVEYGNGSTKIAPIVPASDLGSVQGGSISSLENTNSVGTDVVWVPGADRIVAAYTTGGGDLYLKSFTSVNTGSSSTVNADASRNMDQRTSPQLHYVSTGGSNLVAVFRHGDIIKGRMLLVEATAITARTEFTIVNTGGTEEFTTVYDGSGKLVVFYQDQSDSHKGKAIVCTLGTNTFSVGSAVTFSSSNIRIRKDGADYDQTAGKYLAVYRDQTDSEDLYAIVGTVSGSSISFGTAVEFETGSNEKALVRYDPAAGESIIVVAANHASVNELRRATISGTTPTVESPTAISSIDDQGFDIAWGGDHQRWGYMQQISGAGDAMMIKVTTSASQLTTENYIGISDGAYANGATATVQIVGSVDDAQSGLTPGQSYFVQNDGSLGLTADATVGSVFAGTAVAATKLIVKG